MSNILMCGNEPLGVLQGNAQDIIFTPTSGGGLLSTNVQDAITELDTNKVDKETGKGLFSGSYTDLTDKPTIPAAQVNSDWDSSSGVSEILNKPVVNKVYEENSTGNAPYRVLLSASYDDTSKDDTAKKSNRLRFNPGTGRLDHMGDYYIDKQDGTTSTIGESSIILGNSIASGTDKNSKGVIKIYSDSGYQHKIQVRSNLTANRYLNMPDKTGDIAIAQEYKRVGNVTPTTTYPTLLSYIINYVIPVINNQSYSFPCSGFSDLPVTNWGFDCTVTLSGSIVVKIHKQLSNNEEYVREVSANSQWIGGWTKQPTLLDIYPVGSIYLSVNNTNPGTLFGGTWVAWGSGRVPVGVNTNDSNFNTVEKTGGSSTVTLTTQQIPSHSHSIFNGQYNYTSPGVASSAVCLGGVDATSTNVKTNDAGGGQSHNNLQPYITCYMWKRTA